MTLRTLDAQDHSLPGDQQVLELPLRSACFID